MNAAGTQSVSIPDEYKRPFFKGTVVFMILLIVLLGFLLIRCSYVYHTDLFRGRDNHLAGRAEPVIQEYLDEMALENAADHKEPVFASFKLYGLQEVDPAQKIYEAYIWEVISEFETSTSKGYEPVISGASLPALITLQENEQGDLNVIGFQYPRDGDAYELDLKQYPWSIRKDFERDLNHNHLYDELTQVNLEKAQAALSAD